MALWALSARGCRFAVLQASTRLLNAANAKEATQRGKRPDGKLHIQEKTLQEVKEEADVLEL